jgi:LysR family hydrogen peroxide-inducible transcriptional activator
LLDELLHGTLDLVLLALPWPVGNLEVMPLFNDRFLLACREDTQFVDPKRFAVNKLSAASILLLEEGHCLREHALSACRLRDRRQLGQFAATSLHTLLEIVDGDLGVTFVPEMAAQSGLLRNTRVRTWPLREGASRKIALAWRRGSARAAEYRQLGEIIRGSRKAA